MELFPASTGKGVALGRIDVVAEIEIVDNVDVVVVSRGVVVVVEIEIVDNVDVVVVSCGVVVVAEIEIVGNVDVVVVSCGGVVVAVVVVLYVDMAVDENVVDLELVLVLNDAAEVEVVEMVGIDTDCEQFGGLNPVKH